MYSFRVGRVGGEAVDGIGRVGDQAAIAEDIRGPLEQFVVDFLTLVWHGC